MGIEGKREREREKERDRETDRNGQVDGIMREIDMFGKFGGI